MHEDKLNSIHSFARFLAEGKGRFMICGTSRALAHLAGTISTLLTMLLWLGLLDAGRADRIVDNLAGFQNEYRVVLGAGMLAVVLAFVAAVHAARWWYVAVICSLGTLWFFTYVLSH
jgi:hypothetical protein